MTIKSNLQVRISPNVNWFCRKVIQIGPQNGVLGGKGLNVKVLLYDPQKPHHCAEPHHLTYSASKSVQVSCCRWFKESAKKMKKQLSQLTVHKVVHVQKWNSISDTYKILHDSTYPQSNHPRKFWWWSVKGFGSGRGQILPFPRGFHHHPYNTVALPCECVMNLHLA